MRWQLHHDRAALENLIADQKLTPLTNLNEVEVVAHKYEQLKKFSYIRELELKLSDERALQSSLAETLAAYEERLSQAIVLLKQEARENSDRVKKIYNVIRAISIDEALEAMFHPQPIVRESNSALLHRLSSYREEIVAIFSEQHVIGDGSLAKNCGRLLALIENLARETPSASTESVGRYVFSATEALRQKLIGRTAYALQHYPAALQRHTVLTAYLAHHMFYHSRHQ
jgi:hypothetical protein